VLDISNSFDHEYFSGWGVTERISTLANNRQQRTGLHFGVVGHRNGRRAGRSVPAIGTKDSAFGARYRRVIRHRGHKKAVVAVAHAVLRAIYHVLAEGTTYRELGPDYYDRRHAERVRRRAIHLLELQGYRVVLEPAA